MLCSHHICVSTNECLLYHLFCDSADNRLISSTTCTEIHITQTYLHQHTFDNNKDLSACNYIARRVMYVSFDRGKACKIRTGWKDEIKAGCVILLTSVIMSASSYQTIVLYGDVEQCECLSDMENCVNQMRERQSHDGKASEAMARTNVHPIYRQTSDFALHCYCDQWVRTSIVSP